jgi:hypothetical protein
MSFRHRDRGLSLRKNKKFDSAILEFSRHLKLYPDDNISKYYLAATLGDVGLFEESATQIKKLIAIDFQHKYECWLVYARAQAGLQNVEQAVKAYQYVLNLKYQCTVAHTELAQLIWMTYGDADRAIAFLDKALSAHDNAIELKILKAELLGQMGFNNKRYDLHRNLVLSSENNNFLTKFHLSKAAFSVHKYEEAKILIEQVVETYPQDYNSILHFSNCLIANEQPELCLNILESIESRYPHDQHILAIKSICWRLLSDDRYQLLYDYDNLIKQFYINVPNGWSSLENYLSDLKSELDTMHTYIEHPFFLSIRHGSQLSFITSSKKPAMKAFKEAVETPIKQYLKETSLSNRNIAAKSNGAATLHSCWSVKLSPQGYHASHVHPQGWLSSACHIQLPKECDDSHSGWMKFGEFGEVSIPSLAADKYIKPERGKITIFPSYMWHGTVPCDDGTERLTVASDFLPN